MKLYWIENESRYVHRLSDLPKGMEPVVHEIPTDLAGLMGTLNALHKQIAVSHNNAAILFQVQNTSKVEDPTDDERTFHIEEPVQDVAPCQLPPYETESLRVLSRLDNAGIPVDKVVETIGKSSGYALRRYSGAVAIRFEELSKK